MILDIFRADEACFAIFEEDGDPELPVVHLHSEECWYGVRHSCPLLPTNHEPKKKTELSMVDNMRSLRVAQSFVISCGGDDVNWGMITDFMKENL